MKISHECTNVFIFHHQNWTTVHSSPNASECDLRLSLIYFLFFIFFCLDSCLLVPGSKRIIYFLFSIFFCLGSCLLVLGSKRIIYFLFSIFFFQVTPSSPDQSFSLFASHFLAFTKASIQGETSSFLPSG